MKANDIQIVNKQMKMEIVYRQKAENREIDLVIGRII